MSKKERPGGNRGGNQTQTESDQLTPTGISAQDRAAIAFHPLANEFQLMEGPDFDALVADIKQHGQREPIILHEGKILDGRNRYRACLALGIEPEFKDFGAGTEADALAYVISVNIHRRHLSDDRKREIIDKLILAHPEKSDRQIAEAAGTEHKRVGRARRKLESNGAAPHKPDRTEATGRKARGRKPAAAPPAPPQSKADEIHEQQVRAVERNANFMPPDAPPPADEAARLEQLAEQARAGLVKAEHGLAEEILGRVGCLIVLSQEMSAVRVFLAVLDGRPAAQEIEQLAEWLADLARHYREREAKQAEKPRRMSIEELAALDASDGTKP